ncbi:MAG: DUF4292 domain-containing protein [Bacteroidota bacterium]|nr:DUF4292 domain-containing protein [Bacteroidota bacterium]
MKQLMYLLLFSLILASCKTSQKATSTRADVMKADYVLEQYANTNELAFKSIHINGVTNYGIVNVGLDFRILKDQIILISARIPIGGLVFKLYATPEEIQFYNKMEKEYFVGNYELISNFLGMEMNFQKLQNLLLGKTIEGITAQNTKFSINEYSYQFYSKSEGIITNYFISPKSYNLNKQTFEDPKRGFFASVEYNDYNLYSTNSLPKSLIIHTKESENENTIEINYKSITIDNPNLNFPFEIPNGYQPISIKF